MSAPFVPFHDRPRRGPRSARVGWIVAENGCHLWQGATNGHGYGRVRIDGRTVLVHRVRYEREVGPIPEGARLDHFMCDNGSGGCCNPRHVRPASTRENNLRGRGFAAVHAAATHCIRGHPLAGDNLRPWQAARGRRQCRECARQQQRARRRRERLGGGRS